MFKHVTYVEVPEDVPAGFVNTLASVYDAATEPYDAVLEDVVIDEVVGMDIGDQYSEAVIKPDKEEIDELVEWLETTKRKEAPRDY